MAYRLQPGAAGRSTAIRWAAVLAPAAGLACAGPAQGDDWLWTGNGATANWSDGANWAPAGPPPNPLPAGDDVVFVSPLAARLNSNVDVPWTVESLRFNDQFPSAAILPTFTMTGSALTVNRSVESQGKANVVIGNDLVLAGTDGGRGREVVLSGGGVRFNGAIGGPARLHVSGPGHFISNGLPQNAGSPIGAADPGVRYGLFAEGGGFEFSRFSVEAPGTGSYTLFGDANTAIGLRSGVFSLTPKAGGTLTLNNAIRVLESNGGSLLLSDAPIAHRVNYAGPLLLKGKLTISQTSQLNHGVVDAPDVGGIVADYQGPITVASDHAEIRVISASAGMGDGWISGSIRDDGTPRSLTLRGSAGRALFISGDNTGLTGGIRTMGDGDDKFRFMSLASMGGGGNGNLHIGWGAIVSIGFNLTPEAFASIDPRSTGMLAIDADSSVNLDLSNFDGILGCTAGYDWAPVRHYGRIDPKGDTYIFGGGGGALAISAPHSLSGERGLTLGRHGDEPMTLILDNPQSFTGPVHVLNGQLIVNHPRALHPHSPIRIERGTLRFGAIPSGEPPKARTHEASITLSQGWDARIWASPTSAPDYDLVINGGIVGGTNSSRLDFSGGGRIAINGNNNSYLATTAIQTATVYVNGTISAQGGDFVLQDGTLGGVGTIARRVVHRNFNVVTPGNPAQPIGTLTIDNDLVVEAFGRSRRMTFEFQFGEAGSDLLWVTGGMSSEDGTSGVLKLLPMSGAEILAGATIPFIEIGGEVDRVFPWVVDTSGAPAFAGSYVTFDDVRNRYLVTLVPEPGGWPAMSLSVSVAMLWRRRRSGRGVGRD